MPPSKRVLVCDDERHVVRLVESSLRRQGYTVTSAHTERDAIALLQSRPFDLAVIDGDMRSLLAWIRGNEAMKDLPLKLLDKHHEGGDPPRAPKG